MIQLTEEQQERINEAADGLRLCGVCFEQRRVIARVGPFLIKEPCKNGCAGGYARRKKERNLNP